ncbi:hypothetical protein SKAU_G00063550 [Synaphobranchus kaupii]|uniref:Gypsy retrotransposon integrase-like protein 1 n=1 Tax=Synaphobranchus kaupii TaxID=118154 RepID=A0A9Q1G5H9_SYNKA|nr:hypothetical protein SKAU_G00063550 [Synaphobranchus kaupii]
MVKVVKSAEEASAIFKDFHASPTGAHMGSNKTLDAIGRRFHWPGMSIDVRQWIAACTPCQKKRNIKQHKEYIPIQVSEPFELVGMDLVGKLTPTPRGNLYICVMIDYKTKWAEAYPLKSKKAEDVAQCIVEFFYKFGAPKQILTDRGGEFRNKLNTALCQKLDIERSFCAPYHPQTNGLVERMNGTVTRTLTKLVDEKPWNWDLYLSAAMFGLRTKVQITTKHSPFYLMFGREARYPSEVPETFGVPENIDDIVAEEVLSEGLKQEEEIFKIVSENVEKANAKQKKRRAEQIVLDEIWAGRKKQVIWSKVLNAYLELKMQETSKITKAFVIDCFAMTAIWQGNLKGLRKLEPEKYNILLGAVNENHHWTLVAMYPQQRRALYLDPFGALPAAIEKCTNVTSLPNAS